MNKEQLRDLICEVLLDAGMYSDSAVELLMLTAATESKLGRYVRQVGGPALGIFQMEPNTENDIYINYLKYNEDLEDFVDAYTSDALPDELVWNVAYSILMARIHYLRVKEKLPAATDIRGLASYWKKYYNTHMGKGTVKKAVASYNRYVA